MNAASDGKSRSIAFPKFHGGDRLSECQSFDPRARLRLILDRPRHPGNVGAVARAMRTMGWMRLILIDPLEEDPLEHAQAIAFASRATDVLQAGQVVQSLSEALQGCGVVFAMSGKVHSFAPQALELESALQLAAQYMAQNREVGFLLGNERTGLDNAAVQACQYVVRVDTVDNYDSLNLAQTAMLICAGLRRHVKLVSNQPVTVNLDPMQGEPADADQIDRLIGHMELALIAPD